MSQSDDSLDEALRGYVRGHEGDAVSALCAYVATGGVSSTGEGIAAAAGHLLSLLRTRGSKADLVPSGRHPAVLARLFPGNEPKPTTVLVYGHYDVQPAEAAEWRSPPFAPAVRDGRIYGRGVADNKGQHLAYILALDALQALGIDVSCNLLFLIDGEEEIGSPGLAALALAKREELEAADVVLWSDGPVHDAGAPCISLGVRGVLQFRINAYGAKHPLHSGNWGGVAPNPSWTLVWLLQSMCSPEGAITVDGFEDYAAGVQRFGDSASALDRPLADVKRDLGVAALAPPGGRSLGERLAVYPSLNVTWLAAGDPTTSAIPQIPSEATAYCDLRLVPGQSAARAAQCLEAHIAARTDTAKVTVTASIDPSGTDPSNQYVARVAACVREATGMDPMILPPLGGSLPLHVFTDHLGIPCIGVPFANPDENNHAPNENLELERFLESIVTCGVMLARVGQGE